MTMPFRDTIQDYRRSAARRLEDAKELLEPPTLDAQRSDADRRHLRGRCTWPVMRRNAW